MMKRRRVLCAAAVCLLVLTAGAWANVSLKNGNFFMSYTDITYTGGFEPKLERVYNSKSAFLGIYGWGWGSEYEVYLTILPDGSIVVHEYGGGAQNKFFPEKFDAAGFEAGLNALVQAAQETKAVNNPAEIEKYKTKLRANSMFFTSEWEKYKGKKLVSSPPLPLGTITKSNKFSYQTIKRIRDGYLREFDNGRREQYNDDGRLTRIVDKNGNFISFTLDGNGRWQSLTDNLGRKMTFTFTENGLLEKIVGKSGETGVFRYNDRAELIYSKDVDGNVYEYAYDPLRHNMIKITYSDRTTMEMSYYGMDLKENIKTVKDRDGTLTSYGFKMDPKDKGYLGIEVKVQASDGSVISNSSYEYFVVVDERGIEWTRKMVTVLDGDRTETEYNRIGLPISIKRGSEETKFAYDEKGHVTRKETPYEITELTYDPRASKVSRVMKTSKESKETSWSNFKYDAAANLIYAENSEGKTVALKYDSVGRIEVMTNKDNERIEFTYNVNSKPIEIRRIVGDKTQRIIVTYTASGEIEKVESPDGRQMAMAVTSAFQELLDIIRPAGVNLSF